MPLTAEPSLQPPKYNFKSPTVSRYKMVSAVAVWHPGVSAAGSDLPRGGTAHVKWSPLQRELMWKALTSFIALPGMGVRVLSVSLEHKEH